MVVLEGAPGGEHAASERVTLFAEDLLLAQPVGVAAEISRDMRPARLAPAGIEMAVSVPAVRDHDPWVAGADQRVELLAVAVLGDLKEHGARGGRGPQRATFTARAPAGLIDMHRVPVQNPVLQVQVRAGERVRGALADRVNRASRKRDAEQITSKLGDSTPGDSIPGGQRHDRGLQPRSERRSGDLLWHPGAGPRATRPAAQLMRSMLGPDHADRRQLTDLVATEPPAGATLVVGELATAPATRPRIVIDDLINLILRLQVAAHALVSWLPTYLAPL